MHKECSDNAAKLESITTPDFKPPCRKYKKNTAVSNWANFQSLTWTWGSCLLRKVCSFRFCHQRFTRKMQKKPRRPTKSSGPRYISARHPPPLLQRAPLHSGHDEVVPHWSDPARLLPHLEANGFVSSVQSAFLVCNNSCLSQKLPSNGLSASEKNSCTLRRTARQNKACMMQRTEAAIVQKNIRDYCHLTTRTSLVTKRRIKRKYSKEVWTYCEVTTVWPYSYFS